jgi:hypothetical protein
MRENKIIYLGKTKLKTRSGRRRRKKSKWHSTTTLNHTGHSLDNLRIQLNKLEKGAMLQNTEEYVVLNIVVCHRAKENSNKITLQMGIELKGSNKMKNIKWQAMNGECVTVETDLAAPSS